MVSFLTLLVGLIVGVHDVELEVADPVVRVEIRLDETVIGEIRGEPWRTRVDFGRQIHPVRLAAVGFDQSGREVGRDVQWINLPDNRAEAEIVPVVDDVGNVVSARLRWESPEFDRPRIRIELDGRSVEATPADIIDLTGVTADQLHVLDAEFQFSPELNLKRELIFGKGFAGATSSGLTALPVRLEDLDELPPPDGLEGWFTASGAPVRVSAVDRAAARLVLVRDPGAEPLLRELAAEKKQRTKKSRRSGRRSPPDTVGEDVEIRVLVPEPIAAEGRHRPTVLFPYSKRGVPGDEGVLKAATAVKTKRLLGIGLMLSDGVAMAGLHAASGGVRRAVVLMLGPEREDIVRLDPRAVRAFLDDLRVPLVVWDLSGPASVPPPEWPVDHVIENFDDLQRAIRRLRYNLDEQRIVWLGGRHLPQDLGLGPKAQGISIVR